MNYGASDEPTYTWTAPHGDRRAKWLDETCRCGIGPDGRHHCLGSGGVAGISTDNVHGTCADCGRAVELVNVDRDGLGVLLHHSIEVPDHG